MKRFYLSISYLFLSVLLFGQWRDTGADLMLQGLVNLSADGQTLAVKENQVVSIYHWTNTAGWILGAERLIDPTTTDLSSMVLSPDGQTVALQCFRTDSLGRPTAYVKIYSWDGQHWQQKGSDIQENSHFDGSLSFGSAIAMSADGESLVIGAGLQYQFYEAVGMVYSYHWKNNDWQLVQPVFEGAYYGGQYGRSVGMSADGQYLAILGGYFNRHTKYVDVFRWSGLYWEPAYSTSSRYSLVGSMSLTFAASGTHLIMAQPEGATPTSYGSPRGIYPGRVDVYQFDGNQVEIKGEQIKGPESTSLLGKRTAISADGNIIVIAAPESDTAGRHSGYINSYVWCNEQWEENAAIIKGTANSKIGETLVLSADGRRMVFSDKSCNCLKTYDLPTWSNCPPQNIDDQEETVEFKISKRLYPNPNQGHFYIQMAKEQAATIRIYNMTGQLVYEKASPESSLHEVDFQADTGVYFVEIEQNGEKERFKFIHHGK
ncbi:T9SS type A sorting domain-containing protein [Saprospira sp. CCB-QB6]|uniref:T9SS type A sorting domain-containing protein n=1 Tax=Saprospira sp. CCB-QB6 TaxID=3023936 RepID=UPI00234A9153|nr:T9SS type A sorting domain-containing protein [Saprospira sp. CCB-QB6]WCL81275.1 T9SS type A sorting domain-containing protein [Saprospira sp. CCB-QB6]